MMGSVPLGLRTRRMVLFGVALSLAAACGAPMPLVGIDNRETPTLSVEGASRHKLFIATTREDSEVVGALFSELRAEELGLAAVTVSVPPTHEVGKIERPRSLPPDPNKEFAVIDPVIYGSDSSFVDALNEELRKRPPANRRVLVFIHGYSNTTSSAILRVGQFVEDSGFAGVPVLFTWASAGKTSRYLYDLNSALVARPGLLAATRLIGLSDAREFNIVAHSMGSFLLMETAVSAEQVGGLTPSSRLRFAILASPDIDVDLFRSQMSQIGDAFERVYVLLSEDDYALRTSRWLAGGVPRVGAADTQALEGLGVTAIDLGKIETRRSESHSKFADSPGVVQLIGNGLNASPEFDGEQTLLEDFLDDLPIRVVGDGD